MHTYPHYRGRATRCGSGSGQLVRFPTQHSSCVWVLREDAAWLVLAGSHVHGDYRTARADAEWMADNLGVPIRRAAI
jgi:hypothetical protein